jgi:hypothetical protein
MPLTPSKAAHIQNMVAKTFTGRSTSVILTLRTAGGGTTTLTVQAVWRVIIDDMPTYEGPTNALTHLGVESPIQAEFNAADVTLAQLRSCIYATLTSPGPNQPASRYVLTDIEPTGMLPGGTRYFTRWTRQS